MTYAGQLEIHDADSHIMELPDFLAEYLEADLRDRVFGASVGDCGAWLGGRAAALTAEQVRRPMLGSGAARVVGFDAGFTAGSVLLASDGYGRRHRAIRAITTSRVCNGLQPATRC